MYSFKLCLASPIGSTEVRRIAGDSLEVSTYAKFVELCQSIYPKMIQSDKKVLVKYTDSENDAVIADSEESFQGIHVYCRTMVKSNAQFCLKLAIDFLGEDENSSPFDGDQFVKIETPISNNSVATALAVVAANVPKEATTMVKSSKESTATATAIVESSKQESLPSAASATASATAIVESKQESLPSAASATASATEIKETKCRTCGAPTNNKCAACKTEYFCSSTCTWKHKTHTAYECRDNCIARWKESGLLLFPGELSVGTKVSAKFKGGQYYDGFIASLDRLTNKYAVKYNDGDFSDYVFRDDVHVCMPSKPKPLGLLDEHCKCLTPQATAIVKEIFQRYSEDGLVEVSTKEKGVVNQEMRFMSLTHFRSFASDFSLEKNPAPTMVVEVYYKYATGIASNNVAALLEEGFIRYYTEQARFKSRSVWYDIFSMGYDATLQRVQTNLIRKGEVVLYRPSVQCDFEQAVVLNAVVVRDCTSVREVTNFHIMLLNSGSEKRVSNDLQMIRKCYYKCHKCREPLIQVSLHSFCCCVGCEEPRPDGSAIQSILI